MLHLPGQRCRYGVGVYERAIEVLVAFITAQAFPSQALDGQSVVVLVALTLSPMRNIWLHHSAPAWMLKSSETILNFAKPRKTTQRHQVML